MNKPKEINKYIKEVKKTTGIVEDSIEKGNYSLAIEKLEVTLNDNENKNKYVKILTKSEFLIICGKNAKYKRY